THPEVGAPVVRSEAVPQGRSEPLLEATTPAAPSVHPVATARGRPRIGRKPVLGPLPHVAHHVVEPEGPRRETPHGAAVGLLPAGLAVGRVVPPRILTLLRAAPRRVLPLELRRQPRAAPGAVSGRLVVIDAVDRSGPPGCRYPALSPCGRVGKPPPPRIGPARRGSPPWDPGKRARAASGSPGSPPWRSSRARPPPRAAPPGGAPSPRGRSGPS